MRNAINVSSSIVKKAPHRLFGDFTVAGELGVVDPLTACLRSQIQEARVAADVSGDVLRLKSGMSRACPVRQNHGARRTIQSAPAFGGAITRGRQDGHARR